MKLLGTSVLLFGCLFSSRCSEAQPLNDECANAEIIPPTPTFPYTHTVLEFQNATEGANDPSLTCLTFPSNNISSAAPTAAPPFPTAAPATVNKISVWFSWTPATDGFLDFLAVGGSDLWGLFSPVLAIFQGSACSGAALEEVACGFGVAAAVDVVAGNTYFVFIELDKYDGDSFYENMVANVTLTVQPTPPPPLNDECVNATVIPSDATLPFTTEAVPLSSATENPADPFLTCNFWDNGGNNSTLSPSTIAPSIVRSDGKTVWYSWTPAVSGSYDFSTVGSRDALGYDVYTAIGIFAGDSCDAMDETKCVNYGQLRGNALVAGTTYRIKVGAFVEYGSLILTVQPTPPPPPNDECVNAMVIPSAPTFPYSTAFVELYQATENPSDPFLTCNYNGGGSVDNSTITPSTIAPSFIQSDGKTVWYSWTPAESGSYDFNTTGSYDSYGNELSATIGIFEGGSCDAIEEIKCSIYGPLRRNKLIGGTTYRIKVGAFVEDGNLTLMVNPTPPPPPNDECVNATILPPSPTFPYTTASVELAGATENPSDPLLTCNFFGGGIDNSTLVPSTIAPSFIQSDGKTVWYSWTPTESGSYDFVTTGSLDYYGSQISTVIGIFTGDSCDTTEEVKCTYGGRLRGNALVGGTTYRIKVGAFIEDGSLILTVKPTPPPPANDACVSAIPIDPQAGKVVFSADITDAILDTTLENTCLTLDESSGLWYKIDNANGDVRGIIASTCDEGTTFDTRISIFKGNDCGSTLQCVGSVDDSPDRGCGVSSKISFLTNETTTYWILVHGFGTSYGNYTLTVDSVSSFFALIDADSDSAIELLGDYVNYGYIRTPNLNIEATFSNDVSVGSVQVTFDNPKRSFCKGTAPFSVFGDSNGNYFGKSLPVGPHLVTATAFADASCQGSASAELRQKFEILGCSLYFQVYDATNSSTFFYLDYGFDNQVPSLPCDLNVEASVYCGFDVNGVRMELRDTISNTVVNSRTDMVPPYFLFGDSNSNIASGSIAPGSYSITAWIDGIQHPPLNFTLVDACF